LDNNEALWYGKTMKSEIGKGASEAYGGEQLWSSAKYIEAEVSAKGWAFS
jgi:hypothetical protein